MIWAHLIILAFTAAAVITTDLYGLQWVLGKKERLNATFLRRMHALIWVGLVGMIATGLYMMIPSWEGYLSIDLFKGKMFFVVVLVINATLIGKHMHLPTTRAWKEISTKTRRALVISGFVSTTSWLGAFVLAKILFG